ncbi:MAG TPA: alpha/beta fold hydrolase [Phycisphaerae bacterium]|nr:alpha/beta fold hydrolase [Phycisphaerae bacterium]
MALSIALLTGCFSERSFTYEPEDVVYVDYPASDPPRSTREWTRRTHGELEYLLPYKDRKIGPLTTEELTDASGKPIDVFAHFRKYKSMLHTFFGNITGISHTAQVTGSSHCCVDPAPPWDGFEDIWVPVDDKIKLSGRIGWATRNGERLDTDCIVLLPGLLGDNMRTRAKDIGHLLLKSGFHVLSLEFRSHGQTFARYPENSYSFGVLDAGDLLEVSDWLQGQPQVRETGIIAFSWNANVSLLAAWENARAEDHPSVAPRLKPHLRKRDGKIRYKAGMLCISPVLDFERVVEALDRPWSMWENPVLNAVQGTIGWRSKLRGYDDVNGRLSRLIERELEDAEINYPGAFPDGYDYLRFLSYNGKVSGHKLEDAKVPVLILHAADDPLAYAQEVADFFGETKNPNVAGVILKGGGHDGFAAYCKEYFYSLMINFFDRETGARQATPKTMVAEKPELLAAPVLTEIPPRALR